MRTARADICDFELGQSFDLILYPDCVYRRFIGKDLAEEVVASIPMRCHYPEDLLRRIESEGFSITGTWGGYSGEQYGIGGELVVEFSCGRQST